MADEGDFFAVPPAGGGNDDPQAGEAPILLGGDAPPAPEGDAFAAPPVADAFAAPPVIVSGGSGDENDPTYIGEVSEATPDTDQAPIIMGLEDPNASGADDDNKAGDDEAGKEEPAEPTGPTPMQKWNEEWQETLKQRKEEENTRKAELVEAARVAMEAFTAERETKRQSKMTTNRQDEQAKLEAIEADLENDNSWQRVCKMIEFSHDSTEQAADIKRMRDVLIALKNDPTRAATLST